MRNVNRMGVALIGLSRYWYLLESRCQRLPTWPQKILGRGVDLRVFSGSIVLASLTTQSQTTAGVSCHTVALHRPMVSVDGGEAKPIHVGDGSTDIRGTIPLDAAIL